MKTILRSLALLLTFATFLPMGIQAQDPDPGETCLMCDERVEGDIMGVWWFEHRFDSTGDVESECETAGENFTDGLQARFSSGDDGEPRAAPGCHNDWTTTGCFEHDPCWPDDAEDFTDFRTKVDELLRRSFQVADVQGLRTLRRQIAEIPNLSVDVGRLIAWSCSGRTVIREWKLSENVQRILLDDVE